ncbi:MAG: PKD domain-containing protein, partial [Bacteroidota bacterium]
ISDSAPELYDLDGDGDQDLLVGSRRGRIQYYENTSTAGPAIFTLRSDFFGKIQANVDPLYRNENHSKPRILDYDQDGQVELLVGEVSGKILVYENPELGLTDSLTIAEQWMGLDFQFRASLTAAAIDSTGDLTWVVGNQRGGLFMLNTLRDDTAQVVSPDTCQPAQQFQVSIAADQSTFCAGDTASLQASTTGSNTQFSWLPRLNISANEGASIQAYPAVTTTYILIGQEGECQASDTLTLTVIPVPGAAPTVSDDQICLNDTVELISNASNADQIRWIVAGDTLDDLRPKVSFEQLGSYSTALLVSNLGTCFASYNGPTIKVIPAPKAEFVLSPDASRTIPLNFPVTFTNRSQGATEYLWDFGDGATANFANLNHTYLQEGIFEVSLIATNDEGCSDTASLSIEVAEANLFIPNVFTPNEDGYNDKFQVTFGGGETAQLLIVDRYGRAIFVSDNPASESWDGRNQQGRPMPEGVYFYVFALDGERHKGSITLLR